MKQIFTIPAAIVGAIIGVIGLKVWRDSHLRVETGKPMADRLYRLEREQGFVE